MKIQLISDLHLASRPFTLKRAPAADVVVIAGDFDPIFRHEHRIRAVLNGLDGGPGIIVLGNHDFYQSTMASALQQWTKLLESYPNVQLLNDSSVVLQGVRFTGGTLWTDFALYEPDMPQKQAMHNAMLGISDFQTIWRGDGAGPIMPADLLPLHQSCVEHIEESICADNRPTVVVTHFMPTARAIAPEWVTVGRPLNPYFCSNLEYLLRPNVKLWTFGHTHSSADFVVESTRFCCNPRGYTSRENPHWNDQLVLEI